MNGLDCTIREAMEKLSAPLRARLAPAPSPLPVPDWMAEWTAALRENSEVHARLAETMERDIASRDRHAEAVRENSEAIKESWRRHGEGEDWKSDADTEGDQDD